MKKLKSIRTKTLIFPLFYVAVLIFISLIFSHIYIEQSRFVDDFRDQRMSHYTQVSNAYTEFATNHALIYKTLQDSQLGGSEELFYEESRARLDDAENAIKCLQVIGEETEGGESYIPVDKLSDLISNMNSYNKVAASALMQASVNLDASYKIMAEATIKYSEIIKEFSQLLSSSDKILENNVRMIDEHAVYDLVMFLIVVFLSCIAGFVFSFFYTRHITRPLFNVISTVKEIREGNKAKRCMVETADEIGELAKEVNVLAENLEYAKAVGEEKNTFLANISHEIRTPLNGILATSELLMDQVSVEERAGYVDLINKSSKSLLCVINDILDYSRFEVGKVEINDSKFSIKKLLQDVKDFYMLNAINKNVKLEVNYPDDFLEFYVGDISKIRKILLHLVSNAVKFTFKGYVIIDLKI